MNVFIVTIGSVMEGMVLIGDRMKEMREKNNFTQSALAKKLDLSRSAINAWEMGISIPSAQYLMELSKLFKVSVDYLLELNEKEYIDISSLNRSEKSIMYSLLSYFEENKTTPKISDIDEKLMEEIYNKSKELGIRLPDSVRCILEEKFG